MKLVIATPMYGGQCDGGYADSLMKSQRYFDKNGIEFSTAFIYNESLIQRARNRLASEFIFNTDADYLMFVDADISFEPQWVHELINTGKDLIAGVVPMKGLNMEVMTSAIKLGETDVERFSGHFNFNRLEDDNGYISLHEPHKVARVGTAFMLISRRVLEEMKPYCDTYKSQYERTPIQISYFNVRVKDGQLMSEDYDFCERWREMGNDVYIAPWICTPHRGAYLFRGDLPSHIYLAGRLAEEREKGQG